MHSLKDLLVAVERTGNYHPARPARLSRCRLRNAHRSSVSPRASFDRSSIRATRPMTTTCSEFTVQRSSASDFSNCRSTTRFFTCGPSCVHRRDLVQKVSAVQQQIREHLHATLPGFAGLFDDDKLWSSSVAIAAAAQACHAPRGA